MVFWPGLPVGEAIRRWAGDGGERCSSFVRPFGRRGGPESEAGAVPPRLGLPVGDWFVLLACRCFGPVHELRVVHNVVCWAEPLLGSRSMRDPGFMNPTHIFHTCFKCMFQMFHLLQTYVAFKRFMLQVFCVSEVCSESHGGTARGQVKALI